MWSAVFCLDVPSMCCYMGGVWNRIGLVFEFDLLAAVFRQQLSCFIHFSFFNVVLVCFQNDVGECYVCSVCEVYGICLHFQSNFSFFFEFGSFLIVSIFLLVKS